MIIALSSRFKMFVVVIFLCFIQITAERLRPGDLNLTLENGTVIVLHKDQTWSLADPKAVMPEKDLTLPLKNNRIIKIYVTDNAWKYLEKNEIYAAENLNLTDITTTGSATHAVLNEATAKAIDKAANKALVELKPMLSGKKINPKKMLDCMKRVEKDIQKEENFVDGKGWTVSVTMKLDKGSLYTVINCEEGKEE